MNQSFIFINGFTLLLDPLQQGLIVSIGEIAEQWLLRRSLHSIILSEIGFFFSKSLFSRHDRQMDGPLCHIDLYQPLGLIGGRLV